MLCNEMEIMTIKRYKEYLLYQLHKLIVDKDYKLNDIIATYKLYYSICKITNDDTLIQVDNSNNITKLFYGHIL